MLILYECAVVYVSWLKLLIDTNTHTLKIKKMCNWEVISLQE